MPLPADVAAQEIAALRAKLEQAESAYQELNVRLAGVEAERDHYRAGMVTAQDELRAERFDHDGTRLKLELKTNVVREVVEHRDKWHNRCDAAEARVRELECAATQCARMARAAEKKMEAAIADRDRLQRVVDELAHLHLCADHQPDKWESDGTCPLCEGERLKRVVDGMQDFTDTLLNSEFSVDVAVGESFKAKLDALLREGK